jgi:UDP:flavonoid glycosyltransferase YjiC (YdhE family)
MAKANTRLRLVFAVALQNAGEATRSLEIARGLRDTCPSGYQVEIFFLSHGSRFAHKVLDAGFKIYQCQPILAGTSVQEDLRTHYPEMVGDVTLAGELIRGQRAALSELQPDLVIYGFWPMAALARRMLGLPGICFLPLPLHPDVIGSGLLPDVPDALRPLTYLPLSLRRWLVNLIPKGLKLRAPGFEQRNIRLAAKACGWSDSPLRNVFDMLQAELTLVNDLPEFYTHLALPQSFRIVGPLYAPTASAAQVDPAILRLFQAAEMKPKIFCTMGSSGTKEHLLEAVRALTSGRATNWKSVILVPPAICPLPEVLGSAALGANVYLTDAFVPARLVNGLADVVVSHGGQGTVQTALASGTPIVGVAMQIEQQVNLDHVVTKGAGIRLPLHRWTASNIQQAVHEVLEHPAYRTQARQLQQHVLSMDGKRNAAFAIWDFVSKSL